MGENAYDTQCFIQLPPGVEYVNLNSSSMVKYGKRTDQVCIVYFSLRLIFIAI